MSTTVQRVLGRAANSLLLVLMLAWVGIPFYFLFATSITPEGSTLKGLELPPSVTFDNYAGVLSGYNAIWPALFNSAVITLLTTIIALVLAVPAAYGLSHLRDHRSGRVTYMGFFVLRGIPPISLVLPMYLIFSNLGLLDSLVGLVGAQTALALPYCVWILRVTFDAIPRELEEAADVDGAGAIRTLVSVVLPVAATGIAVAGVMSALFTYVEYLIIAALAGPSTFTFPVYITGFKQDFVNLVGPMTAAAVIGIIPMLVLFGFSQRYMRRVATAGIH